MGYPVHRFVTNIDPNLLCGICSCVLQDAVLTPCGHSFCNSCLNTWLNRPQTNTCPECRSMVINCEVKPILSLRNLIKTFRMNCENSSRGCKHVAMVDDIDSHVKTCGYTPVTCAGCTETVNKVDLASHQIHCEAIADSVKDDDGTPWTRSSRAYSAITSRTELAELLCRIDSLELHITKLKNDLQITETKNKILEREYLRTKQELQSRGTELLDLQYSHFDPDYEYGYSPESIVKLSLLIGKYLLKKPTHIDENRVFCGIRRCYENYSRNNGQYEHDVHMLAATAFASNWFNDSQRFNIHCWLQSIARHRAHVKRTELP